MADYYPLLVRAISALPQKTGENRRAVYDRARSALVRQLRGVDPPLPEGEITRERLSLEEAIRRMEAEYSAQDNGSQDNGALAEAAAAPPAAGPEPARPREREMPSGESAARMRGAPQRPASPPEDEDNLEEDGATEPAYPPGHRESVARARDGQDADETPERRPPGRRGEVRGRAPTRPSMRKDEPARSSLGKFVMWAVLAILVLGGSALGVIYRDSLFRSGPTEMAQDAAGPTTQPKNADRVAPAAGEGSERPVQRPASSGGPLKAVLLEETPGDSQLQPFEGTVTWKTETVSAGPGLPPDIGIRGEITIPERQMKMSFVLRRNNDQTLPASHTIELSFTLPPDFPFEGIGNVAAIRAKPNQQGQGVPLAGLLVKVNPTLFLVGLSLTPSDRQRNLALLQLSSWFDVPLVYTNDKRAIIAFEKGEAGKQVFTDAFTAWGELMQPPPQGPPGDQPQGAPPPAN